MHENVKEALLDTIEFARAKSISVNGQPATIADLLGMSELYLKNNDEVKS